MRRKVLNTLDSRLDQMFRIFPTRNSRRYKSFIGNFFITKAKYNNILKYTSQLKSGSKVVDIGCAEGSLIYLMNRKKKQINFFGYDSGYRSLFEMQNKLHSNIQFKDLDIYHPYYSPKGSNKSESVALSLPKQSNLVIMYDVIPYLTVTTQKNYLSQIGSSLITGGELILTARLNTGTSFQNTGMGGEKYQLLTELSDLLFFASQSGLVLIDIALGNWDCERKRFDIRDIDLLVFKKTDSKMP